MSDLKSPWTNPPGPDNPSLDGSSIDSRGSDPSVTVDAPNGLTQIYWENPPVSTLSSGEESANSVSGLPSLPNRFEPSPEKPPPPPSLNDRSPMTIDERRND
jgi:hypothetical protein